MKNLSTTDLRAILRVTREHAENYTALALLLIAYTGARANEVLTITSDDIRLTVTEKKHSKNSDSKINDNENHSQLERCEVFVRASKNGRSRWVTVNSESLGRMKSLKEKLATERVTLGTLVSESGGAKRADYHKLRRYFDSMQIELWGEIRYSLHSFRHTMALSALKKGYDIVKVKAILGHKSINTTMIYLREYEESLVFDDMPNLLPAV